MNKQKTESGNVHLVIIIVLVIALLGTLGFVYWQNFMQTKPVSVDDNSKTLTVTEWGVTGAYSSPNTLSYTINQNTLYFTVKNREQCGTIEPIARYTGGTLLSNVNRFNGQNQDKMTTVSEYYPKDDTASSTTGNIHIGEYYYLYNAPVFGNWPSADYPATCKDSTKHAADVKSMHDFFQSLKSL